MAYKPQIYVQDMSCVDVAAVNSTFPQKLGSSSPNACLPSLANLTSSFGLLLMLAAPTCSMSGHILG